MIAVDTHLLIYAHREESDFHEQAIALVGPVELLLIALAPIIRSMDPVLVGPFVVVIP